jgi:sugar lactone lactonase YvrE
MPGNAEPVEGSTVAVTDGQATLELVADARATLGEGPVWDEVRGVLWWVDITAGQVRQFDPSTGDDRAMDVGSPVGAVALRRNGTLLAALADGLATLDPGGGSMRTLLRLDADEGCLRCNDGKCDPAGRFWVERMALDAAPGAGALLRVDPDLTVSTHLTGLTVPNGLGWSPDGRTMFFVDSTWREVRAYPYDPATGTMGDGRILARLPDDGSVPDGLTVDEEGHLWVSRWGGSCVVRVAPDGSVVDRIQLPVTRVTSCTFGGRDLGDLYITTARGGADAADLAREPLAGGLFRCRPGVRGMLPARFAG